MAIPLSTGTARERISISRQHGTPYPFNNEGK
jgi:hypothetical protein